MKHGPNRWDARFGAIAAVCWSRSTWSPIRARRRRSATRYRRMKVFTPKGGRGTPRPRARYTKETSTSLMCLLQGIQMALSPVSAIQRIERSRHVDVEAAVVISTIVTGLPAG